MTRHGDVSRALMQDWNLRAMDTDTRHRVPLLISFSGLDGAGKTTQIENLRRCLCELGYGTHLLTFWDDVVVGSKYREGFVHKVYNSERGVGAPGKPVNRRDKNVRKWYLSLARHGLYLLDALHLRRVVARARKDAIAHSRRPQVIVFDRYIYDELANLPLRNPMTRAFIRFVVSITPQPDIAYLLDAEPEAAHARKPEYPVDFMQQCRQSYYQLARQLGKLTLIPAAELTEAKQAVEAALHANVVAAPAPLIETSAEAQEGAAA